MPPTRTGWQPVLSASWVVLRARKASWSFLANNPRAVEILVVLFSGSQFLTEIMLRNPDNFERLVAYRRMARPKSIEQLFGEAQAALEGTSTYLEQSRRPAAVPELGTAAHRSLRPAGFVRLAGSDPPVIQPGRRLYPGLSETGGGTGGWEA